VMQSFGHQVSSQVLGPLRGICSVFCSRAGGGTSTGSCDVGAVPVFWLSLLL